MRVVDSCNIAALEIWSTTLKMKFAFAFCLAGLIIVVSLLGTHQLKSQNEDKQIESPVRAKTLKPRDGDEQFEGDIELARLVVRGTHSDVAAALKQRREEIDWELLYDDRVALVHLAVMNTINP